MTLVMLTPLHFRMGCLMFRRKGSFQNLQPNWKSHGTKILLRFTKSYVLSLETTQKCFLTLTQIIQDAKTIQTVHLPSNHMKEFSINLTHYPKCLWNLPRKQKSPWEEKCLPYFTTEVSRKTFSHKR